jgi:anthraniloyl-CoA monooxygenase
MRIACLGGGPAGLYFAISMKLRDPAHHVDLFERNRPDDTFGWGVVFSDQTVDNLIANDPVSGAIIRDEFAHWDDIEVHIGGETIRSSATASSASAQAPVEHPAGAGAGARRGAPLRA